MDEQTTLALRRMGPSLPLLLPAAARCCCYKAARPGRLKHQHGRSATHARAIKTKRGGH